MTKTDSQLKHDIEAELRWDPRVNADHIDVSVTDGAALLLGTVDTYAERWAAEDATKRVSGVRAFSEDLVVELLEGHRRTDAEIAAAARAALRWNVLVPRSVTTTVDRGTVTLAGEVAWNFERHAAERAVRQLPGVLTVTDAITLKRHASVASVNEHVGTALRRQATADAASIHVDTCDGKVTLTGTASSWRALDDAKNAAWEVAGVTEVIDRMTVSTHLIASDLVREQESSRS